MPIDSDIYFRQENADIMGGIQKGLAMRDMLDQKALQKQAAAGKAQTQKIADRGNQLDNNIKELDYHAKKFAGITNQEQYSAARNEAAAKGEDVSQFPEQYDKGFMDRVTAQTLSQRDILAQQWKEREFAQKERELGANREMRGQEMNSRALDRKESRDERRFLSGIKQDERTEQLATPYGQAISLDDAKQIKEGHVSKKSFDNKVQAMIDLREKHGGGAIFNREDIARGKQLSKDALLEYKNMAKLGVLSKSDEDIINAIIPEDPLEYNSPLAAIQGQDPILHKLKAFKADSDKNFTEATYARTRGNRASPVAPPPPDTPPQQAGGGLFNEAQAAGAGNFESLLKAAPNMNEQDMGAMKWASQNKNDPRAQKILMNLSSKHGGR